jgi:hypothetical protein
MFEELGSFANIQYGSHPEALEGCALGIRQCIAADAKRESITIQAFVRMLRVPQHDILFFFRITMGLKPIVIVIFSK